MGSENSKSSPQPPNTNLRGPHVVVPSNMVPEKSTVFRLMTYNILADEYSKMHPEAVRWPHRREPIFRQIHQYSPDIVALQEVDHYDEFEDELSSKYKGEYLQRPFGKPDGCAVFYDPAKYELIGRKDIMMNDVDRSSARHRTNNVALLVHFLDKQNPSKEIVVVNAHLYWDPAFADVKLDQARHLLAQTKKYLDDRRLILSATADVFVVGDFNSLPQSKVVETLTSSSDVPMLSAYNVLMHPDTNLTPDFDGCLDYIFYSVTDHVGKAGGPMLLSVLDIPKTMKGPYPSVGGEPSDHLPIVAEFARLL
eukprot:PhF_6_TR40609/c0_g1_i1/m.60921/K12603/CNOT6, CCR4; CCR4-NOT transcription complex subunit 6